MLLMKESVLSFIEKTTQPWFTYFQIADKYQKSFKTKPFNLFLKISVYDNYNNRTEFSCLYLPQGHNFLSTVWL